MTTINTNTAALIARLYLERNDKVREEAFARLASGQKVNSSADDAAGLAISARMTAQIQGLKMAAKNANDSNSLAQVADAAMDEVTNMLQRMRELAVQSANGTVNQSDRGSLDGELQSLKAEIDRIATTTQFNSQNLLDGSYENTYQIGDKVGQSLELDIGSIRTSALGMASSSAHNTGLSIVGTRVGGIHGYIRNDIQAGDIKINGQDVGAISQTDGISKILEAINKNIDNVEATAVNTIVANHKGNGITTDGQLQIHRFDHEMNKDRYYFSASSSMEELVANINAETGGVIKASINEEGKLVLSDTGGLNLDVQELPTSPTGPRYGENDGASGFYGDDNFSETYPPPDGFRFLSFIKLTSLDGSPIRIERGNLGLSSPGTEDDLAALGFQETVVAKSENINVDQGAIISVSLGGTLGAQGQYFAATPLAAGGFIASYEDSGGSVYYQRFDMSGNKVGSQVAVGTDYDTHVPSVLELANGNIVTDWQAVSGGFREVRYAVYDSADVLEGSSDAYGAASQAASDDHLNVKLVDLGGNKFAIDYQVHDNFPSTPAIGRKMRIFDYAGNALGNEFYPITDGDNARSDLFSLGSDKVGLIHKHSNNQLKFHVLDTANEVITDTITIRNLSDGVGNHELVKGASSYYVTLNDGNESFIAKLDSSGNLIKSATALSYNGLPQSHYNRLHVAELNEDVLIATFSVGHDGTSNVKGTYAKLFNAHTFEEIQFGSDSVMEVDSAFDQADDSKIITNGEGRAVIVTETGSDRKFNLVNTTFVSNKITAPLNDSYTVIGKEMTNVTTAWGKGDLTINGVKIFDEDIATNSVTGRINAINNFSRDTGVVASAYFEKIFNLSGSHAGTDGTDFKSDELIKINGTTASYGQSLDALINNINAITSKTGVTAEKIGQNLKLSGNGFPGGVNISLSDGKNASISSLLTGNHKPRLRLDSIDNKPISINIGSNAFTQQGNSIKHGLMEANVGAADYDTNEPTMGIGGGSSISGLTVGTQTMARDALGILDQAIDRVNSIRGNLGAIRNRLNYTLDNLSSVSNKTEAARGRILDADFAKETSKLTKTSILGQAATSMLAQANQTKQNILVLFRGFG